jgi:hypothetical protein
MNKSINQKFDEKYPPVRLAPHKGKRTKITSTNIPTAGQKQIKAFLTAQIKQAAQEIMGRKIQHMDAEDYNTGLETAAKHLESLI